LGARHLGESFYWVMHDRCRERWKLLGSANEVPRTFPPTTRACVPSRTLAPWQAFVQG